MSWFDRAKNHALPPAVVGGVAIRGEHVRVRPSLWDHAEAVAARDDAMLRVQSQTPAWRTVAWDVLVELAKCEPVLHSELLWKALDERHIPRPTEPRAIGPVFMRAVREGLLEPGPYVNSTDPKSHRDPMRTYRSRSWTEGEVREAMGR